MCAAGDDSALDAPLSTRAAAVIKQANGGTSSHPCELTVSVRDLLAFQAIYN